MTAIAIAPRAAGTGHGLHVLPRATGTLLGGAGMDERRYLQWLLVPDRGDAVALPVARIDWIGAEDNYLRIHAGTRAYLIRETMERLTGLLDPAVFLRIHRSTLVNLHRVKAFRRWGARDYLVIMESGTELRMSRTYHRTLNGTVGDYRWRVTRDRNAKAPASRERSRGFDLDSNPQGLAPAFWGAVPYPLDYVFRTGVCRTARYFPRARTAMRILHGPIADSPNAGATEMTSKLKLNAEALEITSFYTAATDAERGTVLGADEAAGLASGSGCIQTRLTGPCCENTRGCA